MGTHFTRSKCGCEKLAQLQQLRFLKVVSGGLQVCIKRHNGLTVELLTETCPIRNALTTAASSLFSSFEQSQESAAFAFAVCQMRTC